MATDHQNEQLRATSPIHSVWVAANAGSGKTHVLVSRIIRLLLSGSAPDRLLCLTFTKAAAAEMSERLFNLLGRWALLPDEALRKELAGLGEIDEKGETLQRARRLFAEALESPGGLRIQTIHAFCERLLKRFPLESGVSPQFGVLDDIASNELIVAARDEVLSASGIENQELESSIRALSEFVNDGQLDELIRKVLNERIWISQWMESGGGRSPRSLLKGALGLDAETTEARLYEQSFGLVSKADLQSAVDALRTGTKTDKAFGDLLQSVCNNFAPESLKIFLKAFLTQKLEPRKVLANKGVSDAFPEAVTILEEYRALTVVLNAQLSALFVAEQTGHLLTVGLAVIEAYERQKRSRVMLDYDDLIQRAAALFESPGADWVLYKLDGGIDHVLVDEAQDTSRKQWDIIESIAREFFAGKGAERKRQAANRTVFAVGDIKQSIMSFQGAMPMEFIATRERVKQKADDAKALFERVPLSISYRTAPGILKFVDAVFSDPAVADGVLVDEASIQHDAHRKESDGLVELWPVVVPDARVDPDPWDAPRDRMSEGDSAVILSVRIAQNIVQWIRERVRVFDKQDKYFRAMTPGDVMILVRRRGVLAGEIIRQLKRHGLPVAGADRLVLPQHIAVMDLIALGRFALLPIDDLTLATVLRGPLCNVSETQLFNLAHGRGKRTLWEVLCTKSEVPEFADCVSFLRDVQDAAKHLLPFEFYNYVLSTCGGLNKLLARLGLDAADPIEEFMTLALSYGQSEAPSLEDFLHRIERADTEIKRDQDRAEGAVRVLTVHGSKGLEAPIVILPDTCAMPDNGKHDSVLLDADGVPLWKHDKDRDGPVRARARATDRSERMREYRRLLYVALTRARDQLIICGFEPTKDTPKPDRWHDIAKRAMQQMGAQEVPDDSGVSIFRLGSREHMPESEPSATGAAAKLGSGIPDWLQMPAVGEAQRPALRASHQRANAQVRGGSTLTGAEVSRGSAVHLILQRIASAPADKWGEVAFSISRNCGLADHMVQSVVAEALRVRRAEEFQWLFGPGTVGEFALRGSVSWAGSSQSIDWRIDRLADRGTDVFVGDFKTDQVVPKNVTNIRPEYLRQLALYRRAVSGLFPNRTVTCGILWTAGPRLMEIPDNILDAVEAELDPRVQRS